MEKREGGDKLARKKKDEPGKSIILPTAKNQDNENVWDVDDWDEEEDDWDEDDEMDEASQELFNALMGRLINGGEGGGMTNEQYKGMLLDQLEIWKRVKKTAEEEGAKKTASECQMQIALINKKLKF